MTARAQKIVFGAYTVSSTIGTVVGYAAAADDLKITELGNVDSQTANGATCQTTVTDPGKSASGTLVLTKAAGSAVFQTGFIGQILMITNNGDGSTRPYMVTAWDEAPETDTGRRIATFTAESKDSMIDAYLAGPVDPDTGTASNYVFGGIIGVGSESEDFSVRPPIVLTGGVVGVQNAVGSVYVDGAHWRAVFPKAENSGNNTTWTVTLNYGVDGEFIVSGSANGISLTDADGTFDNILIVVE